MTFIPVKRKRFNLIIGLAMIIILAIIAIATVYLKWSSLIFQGVFFLEAIVFSDIAVKYLLPIYTYYFDSEVFIINKQMGKNIATVCKIDAPKIVAIYSKEEFKTQNKYHVHNVYNYNCNVAPIKQYVLIFEYNSCAEAVFFEPSEEFAETIRAQIRNQ